MANQRAPRVANVGQPVNPDVFDDADDEPEQNIRRGSWIRAIEALERGEVLAYPYRDAAHRNQIEKGLKEAAERLDCSVDLRYKNGAVLVRLGRG